MTATLTGPLPVTGWEVTDEEWRFARKSGLGGSDILAVLGFSSYRTPWDVWAEKTGVRTWQDQGSRATDLGTDLEPWLEQQAAKILRRSVTRTAFRTYAHRDHAWRRCSPDGIVDDGRLTEYKTAGLASGFGTPRGWEDDAIPLGYEFQCRWSMHVMDAPVVEVIALIAGMGVVRRRIERDLELEHDMVGQVADWYRKHIVNGEEPPFGAIDNAAMGRLYPHSAGTHIDLSDTPQALELWIDYRAKRDTESQAKAAKEALGTGLKALMGEHEVALIDNEVIATWANKKGSVDWARMAAELAERAGVPLPDPETYRKPSSRSLNVKDA